MNLNQEFIPARLRGRNLDGLGDLLTDYQLAVQDFSDGYVWLMKNHAAVAATGSTQLMNTYNDLLQKSEGWKQEVAAYQVKPSFWGFLTDIVGTITQPASFDIGGKIISSTELGGIVYGLQQMIAETEQLQLNVQQYQRLVASGVPAGQAVSTIEQSNQTLLDKISGAVKWPAIGLGSLAVVGLLIVFAPEIKAAFRGLKSKRGKQ